MTNELEGEIHRYRAAAWWKVRALNLFIFGAIAILLISSFLWPDGLISKKNTFLRLVALAIVVTFLYYTFLFERRGNNRLLVLFVTLTLAMEMLLRVTGSLAPGAFGWLARGFGGEAPAGLRGSPNVDWRPPQPYFMFSGPAGQTVEMPPNTGGTDAERKTIFNNEGFRIEGNIVTPKPANEVRMFVVGGSTVVLGSPLANTIPGVIESNLRAGGMEQARVYNFGVIASVSGQELSLIVHRLVSLQPDLIIAYDGFNDLWLPWDADPRPGYPLNFWAWEEAIPPIAHPLSRTIGEAAEDSAIIRVLFATKVRQSYAILRALRQSVGYGSTQWKQRIVDTYIKNGMDMCKISRANDILFARFFQPSLHYSLNLDASQLESVGGEQKVRYMVEQRAAVTASFATGLRGHHAPPGCLFKDVSRILENQGSGYYTDMAHVDNRGNQVIGHRIAEDLLRWDALGRK